jgi:hypothetical protein
VRAAANEQHHAVAEEQSVDDVAHGRSLFAVSPRIKAIGDPVPVWVSSVSAMAVIPSDTPI